MNAFENAEQSKGSNETATFSMSDFFHEAHDQGVVAAVKDHQKEAVVGAIGIVGTGVLTAAAIYASRGRILMGLTGAVEEDLANLSVEKPNLLATLKAAATGSKFIGDRTFTPAAFPDNKLRVLADEYLAKQGRLKPAPLPSLTNQSQFDFSKIIKGTASGTRDIFSEFSRMGNRGQSSDIFAAYDQTHYQFEPVRNLATAIRKADGITLRAYEGPSRIVFGEDNSIQHILYNSAANDTGKAGVLTSASYAGLIKNDVLALEAATKASQSSQGFLSRLLGRQISPSKIQQDAVEGARAYVAMDTKAANSYTEYLSQRFGQMTGDSQAWSVHITTDAISPSSGFNWKGELATKFLENNGLAQNPLNRAVASNMSIINGPAESQSSSIRGGAEYLRAKGDENLASYHNEHVRNAWYGHHAQQMSPEVVRTISVITRALGEKAAAEVSIIDRTAELIGTHGKPDEYIGAYNMLKSPFPYTFVGET